MNRISPATNEAIVATLEGQMPDDIHIWEPLNPEDVISVLYSVRDDKESLGTRVGYYHKDPNTATSLNAQASLSVLRPRSEGVSRRWEIEEYDPNEALEVLADMAGEEHRPLPGDHRSTHIKTVTFLAGDGQGNKPEFQEPKERVSTNPDRTYRALARLAKIKLNQAEAGQL